MRTSGIPRDGRLGWDAVETVPAPSSYDAGVARGAPRPCPRKVVREARQDVARASGPSASCPVEDNWLLLPLCDKQK